MRTNDFYALIELVKREVLDSETEYLKLLKVIGNNQRYDFLSQLSIYDRNPKAVACASLICGEIGFIERLCVVKRGFRFSTKVKENKK